MKYWLPIFFAAIFTTTIASAQNYKKIDSLNIALLSIKADTMRVKVYYYLCREYQNFHQDSAIYYGRRALSLAKDIKWDKGIASVYLSLGELCQYKGMLDSVLYYYQQSLDINKKINNKKGVAGAYNDFGTFYYDNNNSVKALEYYLKALEISIEIGDKVNESTLYGNISGIYFEQENYDKAYKYAMQELTTAQNAELPNEEASAFQRLGDLYNKKKDTVIAKENYNKAIAIYKQIGNKTRLAIISTNMAELESNLRKKIEARLAVQKIWDTLNRLHPLSIINTGNIGVSYLEIITKDSLHTIKRGGVIPETNKGILDVADSYLNRAINLSRDVGDREDEGYFLQELANLEETKGNSDKALKYYKQYMDIYDSVYSQESKNKIAEMESRRAIEQRDNQLKISALQISNQKRLRWIYLGVTGTMILIGSMLYFQSRQRRKTNLQLTQINTELDEANKVKARFMGILSHDLRAPVANLANYLHLQKEDPDLMDEANKKLHQEKIENATYNLLTLMEDMILWSKGQMTNFQPQIKSIQVLHLFDDVKKLIPEDAGAEVIFNDPGLLQVESDENFLKTIMRNLTANAIKALGNKSDGKIEWKAWEENAKKFISITDNGPGLTEIQVKNLFSENAVTSSKSGLGLHLIRDLAARLNQKIDVISNPGKGTQIILSI